MEENRGLLTHFSGLIRLIIGVIIVVIVAFLLIRAIGNRNDAKKAEEATTQSQQKDEKESQSSGTTQTKDIVEGDPSTDRASTGAADVATPDESTEETVPRGIADGLASTGPLPETGLGADVLMTTLLSSTAIYLFLKGRQYKKVA